MKSTQLFFLAFLLLVGIQLLAQQVVGTITDTKGAPLAFASIYVKNTSLGVSTDVKGRYVFDFDVGEYVLVYSYLGYKSVEKKISILADSVLRLDLILLEDPTELGEVQVVANTKGLGKSIMAKARQNRKKYLQQLKTFKCETYSKATLDRKLIKPSKSDTLLLVEQAEKLTKKKKKKLDDRKKTIDKNRNAYFAKDNLQLLETVSELYFKSPSTFKEIIVANHDYSNKFQSNITVSIYSGQGEVAPRQWQSSNPYLIYKVTDPDFNFYQNSISFPSICSQPILSPLAINAGLNYRFDYAGAFVENGRKTFKIKVLPRFKSGALFHGFIFIEDTTFAIKSVDLSINRPAMFGAKDFNIHQNYEWIDDKYSLPVRREIIYTIKEGKNHFIGNVSVRHKDYQINPTLPKRFFNNQVKSYAVDAFEKDSMFWVKTRPVKFKAEELLFMQASDSIRLHHESPAYKREQDSIFNHIGIWDVVLNGFGHKNSFSGMSYWFSPLIDQIRPLGIGGYRHALGGGFRKEFSNNQILHFSGDIDYGFSNKDLKGNAGIGYTFIPKKFMRTFVRFGDYYDQINNYESVESIFSRANYVRTKTFSIEQRLELINGLFGELTLKYAEQIPISGLNLAQWSKDLFGEQNTPKEFKEYKKSEIKLRFQYRPFQKYYFYHNKKVIIGSDWPEFFLEYRKGLKGVLGSEVDYDFIELGVQDYRNIGRLGYANWAVKAGSFINHRDLRFLEHKFFRGSDINLFSNPVRSFQLLGPTLNTRNEFFRANFIHHFEGSILNKVPLVRFLKLELAGGASTLLIRDINFAHAEIFAGVERKVMIFKQLFRFGVYGVTSDNTLDKAVFHFKLGVNFYNSYTKKWEY